MMLKTLTPPEIGRGAIKAPLSPSLVEPKARKTPPGLIYVDDLPIDENCAMCAEMDTQMELPGCSTHLSTEQPTIPTQTEAETHTEPAT